MTIPTISEIKGNTILQLLTNVYDTLKNAILRKQNKLVAGDNIVIDENTNTISAIVGGQPVLDDYYTKTEINEITYELGQEIDSKADSTDVYEKTDVYTKLETDALLDDKADIDDVYDKTETDELLDEKADVVDVYNKTEIDTKLGAKANANEVYDKIDVNNLLSTKQNILTAGANITINNNVISANVPNITISSNTPSGGNNGDIWLQY